MARKAKADNSDSKNEDEGAGLHPLLRSLISILLLLHLAGIFLAPMATSIGEAYRIFPDRGRPFRSANTSADTSANTADRATAEQGRGAQAASELAPTIDSQTSANLWLLQKLEPYLDICYLNHGYNFFAPDPDVSLLIRYRIERDDGTPYEGTFPDVRKQWPRLRYHRHFMLSSHSVGLPEGTANAFGQHLLRTYQGHRATLELVRHRLLTQQEVLDGKTLDDPSTYEVLDSLTVNYEEKGTEPVPGELLPTPEAQR